MSRSKWKPVYSRETGSKGEVSNDSTVKPEYINKTVLAHTGNKWKPVYITSKHIGYKIGELVMTKVIPVYKKKSK